MSDRGDGEWSSSSGSAKKDRNLPPREGAFDVITGAGTGGGVAMGAKCGESTFGEESVPVNWSIEGELSAGSSSSIRNEVNLLANEEVFFEGAGESIGAEYPKIREPLSILRSGIFRKNWSSANI